MRLSFFAQLILFVSSNPLLKRSLRTLHKCFISEYDGILYKLDNMLGARMFQIVDTVDTCIERCLMKPGCTAVNFVKTRTLCSFHSSSVDVTDTTTRAYNPNPEVVHASITCKHDSSGPVGCGKPSWFHRPFLRRSRIIGGEEATPHSYPWLVDMRISFPGGYVGTCGASILRVNEFVEESDILLTAAHCVTKNETMWTKPEALDPSQITLELGDHVLNQYDDGQISRRVDLIVFHPEFIFLPEGPINDIALVRLDIPISFSDTIRPICLPQKGDVEPERKLCMAAGWGRSGSHVEDTVVNLKQVLAPAHTNEECKKGWSVSYKEEEMICAGAMDGNSGTCVGDSGGPLACRDNDGSWTQYGVTSFGVAGSCISKNRPGIFVRVSNYVDWILSNMARMTRVGVTDDETVVSEQSTPMLIEVQ